MTAETIPEVRVAIVQTIARLGPAGEPAVSALTPLIKGKDKALAKEVIQALESIGPAAKKAVPALMEALEDPDKNIWPAAHRALNRIGQGELDPDSDKILVALGRIATKEERTVFTSLLELHRRDLGSRSSAKNTLGRCEEFKKRFPKAFYAARIETIIKQAQAVLDRSDRRK